MSSQVCGLEQMPVEILLQIFEELSLSVLCRLKNTSKYLRYIVELMWQREYKTIDVNIRNCFTTDKKYYVALVTACCETVEELRTYQLVELGHEDPGLCERIESFDRLSCIRHLDFPRLTTMQCALDHELFDGLIDFGKSMPALKHLGLHYLSGGKGWGSLDVDNIVASVRTIVNCENLETLQINTSYLGLILDDLLQMSHMRKVVSFRDDIAYLDAYDCELKNRIADSPVIQRVHTFVASIHGHWMENYECVKKFAHAPKMYIVLERCGSIGQSDSVWLKSFPNLELGCSANDYFGTLHDFWAPEKEPLPEIYGENSIQKPRYFSFNNDYNNFCYAPTFGFCIEWTASSKI